MNTNLYSKLQKSKPFFLIAGPCVIETESLMLKTAETLQNLTTRLKLDFVFKSSFLKANRTNNKSYQGPGLEQGLKILQKIKKEFGLPILTDVHESHEVAQVADVADIIQIPAFLCRQTVLIQAAADSGLIVNLKKGQFMAPEDMQSAALKAVDRGNSQIMLTERGTSFGYHNLVVDFRAFSIMHEIGYPVVFDVTHSLQKPSQGNTSGGSPEYAQVMAQAALATGCVSGLFIETHPNPQDALSDSASMLPLNQLPALLESCIRVSQAVL